MSFEEKLKIAYTQIMSIEEFVSEHPSIPKEYIKKVRYMTDQLVGGEWKGISLDMVDGLFLEKQRVREAITISLGVVISPKCVKPYGDTCGYCVDCKNYQGNIAKNIFVRLGL